MNPTTTVLLIAGSGRSGSTLLDILMAGVDDCVAVGELRFLWQRGMVEDRLCGCGERFSACPFWTAVLRRAFPEGVDPVRMIALQARGTRLRHLPLTFARGGRGQDGLEDYRAALGRLVAAIAAVSGKSTVVDSSKLPPYGALLRAAPGVDLRVVHLVRDPRASAFSWSQRKEQPDGGNAGVMQTQGVARSAALWATWNSAAGVLFRGLHEGYARVRYEDLIADPATSLRTVLRVIGAPDTAALPLTDDGRRGLLTTSHTVAGNPDRFHHGSVELRLDERWTTGLSPRDALVVQAIAAPLMLRYGYRLGRAR